MPISAIARTAQAEPLESGALHLTEAGARTRDELLETIRYLRARRLNGSAANISARIPGSDGQIIITSRGMPDDISENDFGLVSLSGEFISGRLGSGIRPVIEMHTHAYGRPGVNAVVHTHSPNATTFAIAHKAIPIHYEPLITRGQTVDIPLTRYGNRNSGTMVGEIDSVLARNPATRALLLANHGLLVFHESAKAAGLLVNVIEEAAEMILKAQAIGGSKPISQAV